MIQAKCIQKFRDKNNHIYGYRLQDINGQTQDFKPENLKQAIINKQINVINLTLTSDMRLVDKSEDKLKSTKLCKKYSCEGIQSTKKQNNAINLFDKMPDIIVEAAEKLDNVMEFALCRDRGEDDDFNEYTMEILEQMVNDYAILINYTNNYNSIYDIETDVIKKSNDKFRSLRHWALALLILDKNINNIIQNILNKHNTDGDFRALVFLTDEYFNKTDDDAKYGIMNWYGYMYDWDDTDNEYIESLNYLIKFFKYKGNSYMVNLMKQCKEFISNIPDEYKDL